MNFVRRATDAVSRSPLLPRSSGMTLIWSDIDLLGSLFKVIEGRTEKKTAETTFDDPEESRTASIGRKSGDPSVTVGKRTQKKRRKKNKNKNEKQDEDSQPSQAFAEHQPEVGKDLTEPDAEERVSNDKVEQEKEPENLLRGGDGRGWAAPDHRPLKKKKKKIRSRQKNLRKDTRPPDKRPAHLTEETLQGGRLPAHRPPSREEEGRFGKR